MKNYENVWQSILPIRMPVIIRIDGKCFHQLTRRCKKPFDPIVADSMDYTAKTLLYNIQNSRFAYVQSDEISLLLIDYNTFQTQQWLGGNIQKMVSISAAIASLAFTKQFSRDALFDSRVFFLPEKEVCNYFIWRQQDATRNAIQGLAQSFYSDKQLFSKNCDEMQEMLFQKGINFNDESPYWKRGRIITKDDIDRNIPIFTADRYFIEKFLKITES